MEERTMIQGYSTDITVAENTAIPFNNVTIKKGCGAELAGPATIQLNKAGIYMVSVDGSIEPAAAGEVSIQLSKDGILQPQAQAIETGATDSITHLSFVTLVQVKENNTCSCCTSPTRIQVINGTEGTFSNINIVVTKLC